LLSLLLNQIKKGNPAADRFAPASRLILRLEHAYFKTALTTLEAFQCWTSTNANCHADTFWRGGARDTVREYDAVNGGKARGGSLDGGGPAVVGAMVYINSGYGTFPGMQGNVPLAFSVDRK
jgi:hypothetical protein